MSGRRVGRGWPSVIAAMLALTVSSGPLLQFSFAVFLAPVSAALEADRTAVSLALAAGMAASGLATPLVGYWMDRRGAAAITLPAVPLLALAYAAIGLFSHSVAAFVALYAVAGLLSAAVAPLPFAKTIAHRFVERRGLAIGLAMAGVGIGAALLPQAAAAAAHAFGWRMAYVGVAILLFAIGLPFSALALAGRHDPAAPSATMTGPAAGDVYRTGTYWRMALAFFLMALACNGVIAHLLTLMTDNGLSAADGLRALSAAGAMVIVGRLLSGCLLDRFRPPVVAATFFCAPLAGIALLGFGGSAASALAGSMLVGLGLGAEVDLIAFLLCRYFGQRAFGVLYGNLFLIFTLGSALGPLVMGLSLRSGSYTPALLLLMLLLAGGAAIVLTLERGRAPFSPDRVAAY